MTLLYYFLVLALAVFRLSRLLAYEDGPLGMLNQLRFIAGVRQDESTGIQYGKNNFAAGLICTYCNSVWLGLLAVVFLQVSPVLTIFLLSPFALSGVVVIIEEVTHGKG